MKAEQVVFSNLAKVIKHQIEQTHQTGYQDFTVFAQSAYLPKENSKNPNEQVVVLRGPLIMTYYTPKGMPPYYRVAKEFWSASSATAHIQENPEDSSAALTVTLDNGVMFPRRMSDSESSQAGVSAFQFGPVLIPSPHRAKNQVHEHLRVEGSAKRSQPGETGEIGAE